MQDSAGQEQTLVLPKKLGALVPLDMDFIMIAALPLMPVSVYQLHIPGAVEQ